MSQAFGNLKRGSSSRYEMGQKKYNNKYEEIVFQYVFNP